MGDGLVGGRLGKQFRLARRVSRYCDKNIYLDSPNRDHLRHSPDMTLLSMKSFGIATRYWLTYYLTSGCLQDAKTIEFLRHKVSRVMDFCIPVFGD